MLEKDSNARKLTELYIRISESQKDIETENTLRQDCLDRIAALTVERDAQQEKIRMREAQIAATEGDLKREGEELETAKATLAEITESRSAIEQGGAEFERKLTDVNNRLRDKQNQKELILREYTKCEGKLTGLRESQDKLASKLWDEYEMTRNEALALGYPPLTKETRPEMVTLQTECKNKLRAMGSVDLDAVNKYEDVRVRYEKMKADLDDLEESRKKTILVIADLETDMKTAFVESFNQINENFGRVFSELFGGGSAELSLSDPENVLESGIEIKAAPPGKIIKNLMQLSGGEQAFIGVALFFAILQVNPTPFCILDEIEAALDEVNVERLAQYIKRYSHGTQFIMITHRRGTMAAADRLYGVTMPEHGISKVLMLNINDISKKEGEDWDGIFG